MFLLMAVGFLANRVGFIHEQTSKDLTAILLYIVSPCLIIKAFEQPFSVHQLTQLSLAFVGTVLSYLVAIIVGRLAFHRVKNTEQRTALQFGTVYSNAGFMGIPLTNALFGSAGVFYSVPYLAVFNLFNWTHGINLFKSEKNQSSRRYMVRSVLTNPNIIAIVIGLIVFLASFKLPTILQSGVNYISGINTPLSMMVIGNSIASIKWRELFSDHLIWPGILLRNIVMPFLTLLILAVIGLHGTALLATATMAACPVAGIVVLFTLLNDGDPAFAVKLMSLSTLFSIVSLPLMIAIAAL
ncbi:AEC family transporter [Loigolactobacillus backii]|nr:AEC family transporter [Loigolactobacillus backii]OLF69613.1 transporter [Loigolactobacillus backii]